MDVNLNQDADDGYCDSEGKSYAFGCRDQRWTVKIHPENSQVWTEEMNHKAWLRCAGNYLYKNSLRKCLEHEWRRQFGYHVTEAALVGQIKKEMTTRCQFLIKSKRRSETAEVQKAKRRHMSRVHAQVKHVVHESIIQQVCHGTQSNVVRNHKIIRGCADQCQVSQSARRLINTQHPTTVNVFPEIKERADETQAPRGTLMIHDSFTAQPYLINTVESVVDYLVGLLGVDVSEIDSSELIYFGDAGPFGASKKILSILLRVVLVTKNAEKYVSGYWPFAVLTGSEEKAIAQWHKVLQEELTSFLGNDNYIQKLGLQCIVITGDHSWFGHFFPVKQSDSPFRCVKCHLVCNAWPYFCSFCPPYLNRDNSVFERVGEAAQSTNTKMKARAHSLRFKGISGPSLLLAGDRPEAFLKAMSILHSTLHLFSEVIFPMLAFLLADGRSHKEYMNLLNSMDACVGEVRDVLTRSVKHTFGFANNKEIRVHLNSGKRLEKYQFFVVRNYEKLQQATDCPYLQTLLAVINNLSYLTTVDWDCTTTDKRYYSLYVSQWVAVQLLDDKMFGQQEDHKFFRGHYWHDLAHLEHFLESSMCNVVDISEALPEKLNNKIFAEHARTGSDGQRELFSRPLSKMVVRGMGHVRARASKMRLEAPRSIVFLSCCASSCPAIMTNLLYLACLPESAIKPTQVKFEFAATWPEKDDCSFSYPVCVCGEHKYSLANLYWPKLVAQEQIHSVIQDHLDSLSSKVMTFCRSNTFCAEFKQNATAEQIKRGLYTLKRQLYVSTSVACGLYCRYGHTNHRFVYMHSPEGQRLIKIWRLKAGFHTSLSELCGLFLRKQRLEGPDISKAICLCIGEILMELTRYEPSDLIELKKDLTYMLGLAYDVIQLMTRACASNKKMRVFLTASARLFPRIADCLASPDDVLFQVATLLQSWPENPAQCVSQVDSLLTPK